MMIWALIIIVVYVVLILWPVYRIVSKAGYSGAWSLLALIPLVNIAAMWVFSFLRWPHVEAGGSSQPDVNAF